MSVRKCKGKGCSKTLPEGYPYDKCESCRNKGIEITKKVVGGVALTLGTIGSILLCAFASNKNSKNE